METENAILNAIVKISKATKDSKTVNFNKSIHHRLAKPLTEKLNIGTEEAIFFAIIFKLFYERSNSVDISDMASHLECDTIEVLSKNVFIRNLVKRKLINVSCQNNYKMYSALDNNAYTIRRKVQDFILSEKELNDVEEINDNISLVRNIAELMEVYLEKDISLTDFDTDVTELLKEHKHLFFAEKIHLLNMDSDAEKIFLLYLVIKAYKGDDGIMLNSALDDLFWAGRADSDHFKMNIIKGKSLLEKKKMIEIEKSHWRNDVEVKLTSGGAEFLFGPEADFFLLSREKKTKNRFEIPYTEITEKPLFYNPEDLPTIEFMHNTLQEENYQKIITRLEEKKTSKGLTILLHGKPGTGKTESVYQIAKMTGRHIYKVEVSELKSMWFGESQRKIKKLFLDYYTYAKEQEKTPILLFNEADAVINKRKDSNSSTVAQTENEIQNILLQEMEDFTGIMMATTNLIDNIDSAFDRRFLIKLELHVPNAYTRQQIIRSSVHHLSDEECRRLAESFEFTGGVLQNIIRKSYMHEVLHNETPTLDWYTQLCQQENLHQKEARSKVGFK